MDTAIRYTSLLELLNKFKRDTGVSLFANIGSALEWTGEVLADIGTHMPYKNVQVAKEVYQYKIKLPCTIEVLNGIEYKGCMLTNPTLQAFDADYVKDFRYSNDFFYSIKYPYIHINAADGEEVIVHYGDFMKDDEGYLCVPDEVNTKEAVIWYFAYKTMLTGTKHPAIQDWREAFTLYEMYRDRATNAHLHISPDKAVHVMGRFSSIIPSFEIQNT